VEMADAPGAASDACCADGLLTYNPLEGEHERGTAGSHVRKRRLSTVAVDEDERHCGSLVLPSVAGVTATANVAGAAGAATSSMGAARRSSAVSSHHTTPATSMTSPVAQYQVLLDVTE